MNKRKPTNLLYVLKLSGSRSSRHYLIQMIMIQKCFIRFRYNLLVCDLQKYLYKLIGTRTTKVDQYLADITWYNKFWLDFLGGLERWLADDEALAWFCEVD